MFSNQLIGFHKFVLFVDDIGAERGSSKILESILKEQNVAFHKYEHNSEIKTPNSVIILPPISKLELLHNEQSIAKIIQTLKIDPNVSQIFGWATCKNINSRLLIPFLEHMSDVVVKIKSDRLLTILTKRKFGSTKIKEYQHELLNGKIGIKEVKEVKTDSTVTIETDDPEKMGTFKIGEYNSNELEAKKNLKLPFEIM